jgi:uncharacterized damage-inducible protein DinB
MSQYRTLARFNRWANEHIYGCVAELPEPAYREDRGAFFGSVHNTLNHILVLDKLWRGRLQDRDLGVHTLEQILYDDFEALRAERIQEDDELISLADGYTEDGLAAPLVYQSVDGNTYEVPVGLILNTLFNHQTHHRGQIHCLLTQSGLTIPPLDILFFTKHFV